MSKDEKQFQIGILAKLIGKELSEKLEKEKIEAWIDEFDTCGWHRIIFEKVVQVSFRRAIPELSAFERTAFGGGFIEVIKVDVCTYTEKPSLETIKRETLNLKADFPEMVQNAVDEFKTREVQYKA